MNNPYENLVKMMRGQAEAPAANGIQLAVMLSGTSCRIGDLTLTAEDLYIPDRLLAPACTQVSGICSDGEALADTSSYSRALAAGDTVAVCPLGSGQKYLVLERVVEVG